VHTLWEKAIWFRHPDYDPDQAQKLISSSMSRHLSIRKMSSKYMHAFLSNLANRQTNIAGNCIYLFRCWRSINRYVSETIEDKHNGRLIRLIKTDRVHQYYVYRRSRSFAAVPVWRSTSWPAPRTPSGPRVWRVDTSAVQSRRLGEWALLHSIENKNQC